MGPRLVFVHGIGHPMRVDEALSQWSDALLKGAVQAGHSWLEAAFGRGEVSATLAYYGDLFERPGAQGGGLDLPTPAAEILVELCLVIVDNRLAAGPEPTEEAMLTRIRTALRPAGVPQGVGDLVRRAINAATTLLGAGLLRGFGQWASGRLLVRDLAQVARYLARGEADAAGDTLDTRIRDRVRDAIGAGPAVVVSHSLGTVVCLEALHDVACDVPLWLTLGSPIGMRAVVWPRLRPWPPATPPTVARWLNVWDRDDVIVARPNLLKDMAANERGVRPVTVRTDSDGWWVHPVVKYLAQAAVAGPVAETVASLVHRT
jgi:hypothetical protein